MKGKTIRLSVTAEGAKKLEKMSRDKEDRKNKLRERYKSGELDHLFK